MSDGREFPRTGLEDKVGRGGQVIDAGYLIYKDIKVPLGQIEYAAATSMLNPKGLNRAEASKIRLSLRRQPQRIRVREVIDESTLSNAILGLRQKVAEAFGTDLSVPRLSGGGRGDRTQGLKFLINDELKARLRRRPAPQSGVVTRLDERSQWHLYVNGTEIRPAGRAGISEVQRRIIVGAVSKAGFVEASLEATILKNSIGFAITELRRALEKEVGLTLTRRIGGRPIRRVPVKLVPYVPK